MHDCSTGNYLLINWQIHCFAVSGFQEENRIIREVWRSLVIIFIHSSNATPFPSAIIKRFNMERREFLRLVAKVFIATNQALGFQLLPVNPRWLAKTRLVPVYIRSERERYHHPWTGHFIRLNGRKERSQSHGSIRSGKGWRRFSMRIFSFSSRTTSMDQLIR